MKRLKILVAIPVYNCQLQALRVLEEFTSDLLDRIDTIVFLDNCSDDNSPQILWEKIQDRELKNVYVFENNENYNLGGSQKLAFKMAINDNFDYVAILHGDNQAKNSDLHKLIDCAYKYKDLEVVMGARFHPQSKRIGYSLLRTWGNIVINVIYGIFTHRLIWDLGSGLNLYKVSALKKIDYLSCDNGLTFNMDLLLKIISARLNICYVPITWREEDQVSNAKIFSVGLKSLTTLRDWFFKKSKPAMGSDYSSKKLT